jgi:hypothetical protein
VTITRSPLVKGSSPVWRLFLASRKLGGLVVTEVNPTTILGGELTHLIDDQVAALARQLLSQVELRTIRS